MATMPAFLRKNEAAPVPAPETITRTARARAGRDPFLLRAGRVWHLFFEVWNWHENKGEIGHATSADGLDWQYDRIVLAEEFHLSYPYVFEWAGERWLVRLPKNKEELPKREGEFPALVLREPKSVLFKFWARSDPDVVGAPPKKAGYHLSPHPIDQKKDAHRKRLRRWAA